MRGPRQLTAQGDRSRKPLAREPSTIRALFLAPLIHALETKGVDIDGFLEPYGLSRARLTSLYDRIPLRHFVAIAEHASSRLGQPFLGLELGKNFSFPDLGPFYAILILSRDLRCALERLTRYESAWQTNTTLDVIRGKDTSTCRYLIEDVSIWPRRQDAEFALASVTTFIRRLTSKSWRPLAVGFEHDIKGRFNSLKLFFKAPVRGNQQINSLVISNEDLDQRLRWSLDPGEEDIAPILERHLMELLGPTGEGERTVAARASSLIAKRLGRTSVAIDMIAAEMNTSVRSLRRHLTEEGTSFRQMLQEHRRTMIEAVLRSDGTRLSDLADRIGYSDSAVLSRAFKAWTGVSPRTYRKSMKS